jgi:molybdopterin converting factor small subunit
MNKCTEVYLFGSIGIDQGGTGIDRIQSDIQDDIQLEDFLNRLKITPGKVQLVMVNHKAVQHNHMIHPGDRVALFPREYPVYPDWKDFR